MLLLARTLLFPRAHIFEVILTLCTTAFSLLLKTTSFLVLFAAGTNARISSPFLLSKIGMLMGYRFNFKHSRAFIYLTSFRKHLSAVCRAASSRVSNLNKLKRHQYQDSQTPVLKKATFSRSQRLK